MSNFIERILGVKPFEDEIKDSDEECYFENLIREREKLKEKTFNTEEDLTSLTNAELKSICDELGIKYTSSATKATLVRSILEAQGGN